MIISSRVIKLQQFGIYRLQFSPQRECYDLINRFVVQSAKVPSHNSQLINSVKIHRATSYAYSSWIKKTINLPLDVSE